MKPRRGAGGIEKSGAALETGCWDMSYLKKVFVERRTPPLSGEAQPSLVPYSRTIYVCSEPGTGHRPIGWSPVVGSNVSQH
jgi:hypothetical protein